MIKINIFEGWRMSPITALKEGNVISCATGVKRFQIILNIFVIIAPAIASFIPDFNLTTDQYTQFMSAMGGLNVYLINITSDKVGV